MLTQLPTLGVGMGFREPYLSDLFLHRQDVDFLEITADHYMDIGIEKQKELDLLAAHFTLIPHGLNLSLGSAEGLDASYARKLAHLIRRLNPPWWSEHIAFTRAGGVEIGHLSSMPFTYEAIEVIVRNITKMRQYLKIEVPLILENITYMVEIPGAEMNEAQFLAELLERADCGLLLDVTNLYTNAVNHGYDLQAMVEQLPLERVVQLHFAGGFWHDGVLIDNHSHPTAPEVWDLMGEIVAHAPVKGIILERDEELPPFMELREEIQRAREIGRRWRRWA